MIPVELAILVMLFHFLADFVCQSHEMATKKATSLTWLLIHIGAYTAVLFLCMWPTIGLNAALTFCSLNGLLHLVTDFFTSKGTRHFFQKGDYHNGFVVVGIDQFIHVSLLLITL